jgi:hypothetical protein
VAAQTASEIWVYVANDRVGEFRDLLKGGFDPNFQSKGQPLIMEAIRDGSWKVYDLLAADPRTNVNIANAHDETPLMYLAIVGQTARAQALIARGAQVNRLGWTPLHYAASKGHVDTARLLLKDKAIVNAPGPDGTTPLMMAALSGNQDMVQALLDAGADVSMRNLQNLDAAAWARSAHYDDLANSLDQLREKHESALNARSGTGDAQQEAQPAQPAGAAGMGTAPAADGGAAGTAPAAGSAPALAPAPGDGTLHGVSGVRLDPAGAPSTP